ncbi:helix-turn-helix transcriptional regulator (plasmid) [Novosphingobium sp. EMRT-2]|nr:helix-turn-helix transcriptional regulator [Novosphingobium sp. EMRT-2]
MAIYLHLDDMAHPLSKLFGKRLRERRQALKMSQAMLHEQTGVTASYISFIENGKANPTLDVMAQLADAIGWNVSEMLAAEA